MTMNHITWEQTDVLCDAICVTVMSVTGMSVMSVQTVKPLQNENGKIEPAAAHSLCTTVRMSSGYLVPALRKKADAAKAALGPSGDDFANEKMFPTLGGTSAKVMPKMNFGSVVKERIRLDEEEAQRAAVWDEMNPTNMTDAELEATGWAKLLLLPPNADAADVIAFHRYYVQKMVAREAAFYQ